MAAKLEPDDNHIQSALQKARNFEARQEAEGRHKFKRKHDGGSGGGQQQRQKEGGAGKQDQQKKKKLLSFGDDEEEG